MRKKLKFNIESELDEKLKICNFYFKNDLLIFNLDKRNKYRAEVFLMESEYDDRVYYCVHLIEVKTNKKMLFNKNLINKIVVDNPDNFILFAEKDLDYAIENGLIKNALNNLDLNNINNKK